jgi:hypothetical protein
MALIPKIEPRQEKKIVTARLDEETHAKLERYGAFLGGATHNYIIAESLKRLFRRDREFNQWLETQHRDSQNESRTNIVSVQAEPATGKTAARFA